jgi:hypothetical protein
MGLPTSANASQGGYAGGLADGFLTVLTPNAPAAATTSAVAPAATAEFSPRRAVRREAVRSSRGCLAPAAHRGIEPCLQ